MDRGISGDADPGRFMAGERRLIGGHYLRMHHVRDLKLGVIVERGGQIEALIARPVAIARQSDKIDNPPRGPGRIRL
jgi:hypothetical protein